MRPQRRVNVRPAQMLKGLSRMKTTAPCPGTYSQKGVVLLESLIAILVFSLGVLGIVGLQAAMIKSTADAKYRSEANLIAQQRIGQLWADPAVTNPSDLNANVDVSTQLPNGTRTLTLLDAAQGQYQVVVSWQVPGAEPHRFTLIANVRGGS